MIRRVLGDLGDESGAISVYALLMLGLLLLVASLVLDIGAIRAKRLRFEEALEHAAVVAAGQIDPSRLASTGEIHLDPSAAAVAREYLTRNLRPLAGQIAGATPEAVSQAAQVGVTEPGDIDPITGHVVEAPTVSIEAEVPVRTGLLGLAGLPEVRSLRVAASAAARS